MKYLLAWLLIFGCCAVVSVGTARPQTRQQNKRGFLVGIFRPDGAIVPFARYANGKWSNPWHRPPPDQPDELPTIADLQKPWYQSFVKQNRNWYVALEPGSTTILTASRSLEVCSHCQKVWGLSTNYPKAKPHPENECVRNLGIALSHNKQASALERLTNRSPGYKQIAAFAASLFDRAEAAGITGKFVQHWAAQIPPPAERAKVPLSVMHVYRLRVPSEHRTLFYFEVSKEYPKPPEAHDSGCNNISMFGGWASRDTTGRLRLLDSQFWPTDCDRKEVGIALPLAILTLDGKTFAVVEEDSYEGESYVILEIGRRRIKRVLETFAGSC